MGVYFSLIKTKNAERYNLWGRSGNKYAPEHTSWGSGEYDPPATPFKFSEIYKHNDDFIINVAENIIPSHIELSKNQTILEYATELVDDINKWCKDDEVILVSDTYYDNLVYDLKGHYHRDKQGRVILLTGSAYTDEKKQIQEVLDYILNNSIEE